MNIKDMSITALVPARKENVGFIDKNILSFGDSNLLVYKLRQLKKVKGINQIVVSSDDQVILEIAESEGAIALKRPYEYAKKEILFGKFVEYICQQIDSTHIMWACVTSPFVDETKYEEAIRTYFEKLEEGYDSLITVQNHKRFILDKNGTVNYKRGLQHKESSSLSELYLYTNGIALAPRKKMIEWKYNWGHIPYMLNVDKKTGIDISDRFDYEIAKLILKENELSEE